MTAPLLAAVVGSPIKQSLSPAIHGAAFRARGLEGRYEAIECGVSDLADVIGTLRRAGVVGFSVTMPCKEVMFDLCDRVDPSAALLRAVNCVKCDGDRLIGFNTDGDGCCDALVEQGLVELSGSTAVVLGAGGTARSIALALLRRGCNVVVVNRTRSRAESMVTALSQAPDVKAHIRCGSVADVAAAEVVVNATSVGMGSGDSPVEAASLRSDLVVLDAVYHPLETAFLSAAIAAGARTVDGLWMLIHQARRQQEIWFGSRPDPGPMRAESERVLRGRATSL